jgi:ABC-type antimicrobial peptide transport system permease subunit
MPRSGVLKKTNPKSSYFADAREKFKEHRLAVFGLAVLTALVVIVVFAPMLFPPGSLHFRLFRIRDLPSASIPGNGPVAGPVAG